MAYRCHKNFFRKSKLNLKTPLAYRCHRPICIAVGKEDILLQQSGSTINSHVFKMEEFSRRDSLLRRGLHEVSSEGKVSAQGVMGRAK
jgi:hypothetical protein